MCQPIISQVFEDLLMYRMDRLTSVAGAMVVRLYEEGYGITRREWRILALLQAISRNILAVLNDTQAWQFNASLERLQASARALHEQMSGELPKTHRHLGQKGKALS